MFHTLLDMADVRYPDERLEWSFVNPGFKQHKRYVDSYGWTDYDHATIKGDCHEVIAKGKPLPEAGQAHTHDRRVAADQRQLQCPHPAARIQQQQRADRRVDQAGGQQHRLLRTCGHAACRQPRHAVRMRPAEPGHVGGDQPQQGHRRRHQRRGPGPGGDDALVGPRKTHRVAQRTPQQRGGRAGVGGIAAIGALLQHQQRFRRQRTGRNHAGDAGDHARERHRQIHHQRRRSLHAAAQRAEVTGHRRRARPHHGQLARHAALRQHQPDHHRRQIVDVHRLYLGAVRHRHHQHRQGRQHAEHHAAGAILAIHQRRPDDGGAEPTRQQVGFGSALAAPVAGGGVRMAAQRGHLHHAPHAEALAGREHGHRRGAVQAVEIAVARFADNADAVDHRIHAGQQRQPVVLIGHAAEIDLDPVLRTLVRRTAAAGADHVAARRAQRTQGVAADQSRRSKYQHFHTASVCYFCKNRNYHSKKHDF
jgi:hypothetical protein